MSCAKAAESWGNHQSYGEGTESAAGHPAWFLPSGNGRTRMRDEIMELEKLWRQLQALPPEEQRQVADFISFLATRYYRLGLRQRLTKSQLVDEPFVGLWQDREDLADSTSWIRHVRQREWGS